MPNMVDGPKPGGDGQFLMAIHVAAFEDPDYFKRRIDEIVRQIRESKRAPEGEKIYAPGGIEAESEQRHRQEGIPLNAITIDGLVNCAADCGIDPGVLQNA